MAGEKIDQRLFGQQVRAIRKERRLTQATLAERLGVTEEYLGKIERGQASPSFPLLTELARCLKVRLKDLFDFAAARPASAAARAGEAEAAGPGSTLLPESRHRLRSHLSTLSGLIRMEEQRARAEETRAVLRDLAARVRGFGDLEACLSLDRPGGVEICQKLREVFATVSALYPSPRVEAVFKADPLHAPGEVAWALGLVLTEFLTNMYKHAFPGRDSGRFTLTLEAQGGAVRLRLADNGVGLPEGRLQARPDAFGLALVEQVVREQLGGSLRLANRNGATMTVTFPLPPVPKQ